MTNDGLKGTKGKVLCLQGQSSRRLGEDSLREESNTELKEDREGLFEI